MRAADGVEWDVAKAIGGDKSKIKVTHIEAGSIIVKLQLNKGVCGASKLPREAAIRLMDQADTPWSILKSGVWTCKTKAVQLIDTVPTKAVQITVIPPPRALAAGRTLESPPPRHVQGIIGFPSPATLHPVASPHVHVNVRVNGDKARSSSAQAHGGRLMQAVVCTVSPTPVSGVHLAPATQNSQLEDVTEDAVNDLLWL